MSSEKKKKGAAPEDRSCANCNAAESNDTNLSACSRCGLVLYCSKDCQRAHWKPSHKQHCVAKIDRTLPTPEAQALSSEARKAALAAAEGEECAICLEALLASTSAVTTLPCKHVFHAACIEGLRKFGINKSVCPMCRGELPPGLMQACDGAIRHYFALRDRLQRKWGKAWESTLLAAEFTSAEQGEVDDIDRTLLEVRAAADGVSREFMLASNCLGSIYMEAKKDDVASSKFYREAAEAGLRAAQYNLALACDFGRGVKQSDSEALKWYTKAAEQGSGEAQHNLAMMHRNGQGVRADPFKAFQWQMQAATQTEHPAVSGAAHNDLGSMYEEGDGVAEDTSAAFSHYRQSALKGDATGENNLGKCYAKGLGVKKDMREAIKWYKRAGEHGNVLAWGNLGNRYFQGGDGIVRDMVKAARYWRKAADACALIAPSEEPEPPLVDACYNLGICCANGSGVAKDTAEAKRLFQLAASHGHPQAIDILRSF